MIVDAYVALGSNLNNPLKQVCRAVASLDALADISVIQQSSWYRSVAIGPNGQPDYINGVVKITTSLQPLALLDALQTIENQQGRTREIRWGARTLDLDLLLYGEHPFQHERLSIPHAEMHNRNFVLQPLLEINQNIRMPDGTIVSELLNAIGTAGLEKLSSKNAE
ncbi:2-amino-4-hydroxy-6-hydroxymethyldihydropteridinepyrophosphokinase [Thalassocella blandensis]|nr:2-amino-4-hydroxy-6-hydroxymethyldihydropteridinepyrophosphokinase [Thalassocella blandensis]